MEKKDIIICGLGAGAIVLTNINPFCGKCIEHAIRTPHIIEIQHSQNHGRLISVIGETSMAINTSAGSGSLISFDNNVFYLNN